MQKICVIIEKYGLTRFDGGKTEKEIWYRVRKNWQDAESQVGAFKVLENAKKSADEHPGFSVFDENGKAVYSSVDKKQEEVFRPYLVRVEISDLNIRKKRERIRRRLENIRVLAVLLLLLRLTVSEHQSGGC